MFAGFAFMERGECGHLVWRRSLLVVWFWCLFFKMSRSQLVMGLLKAEELLFFEGWRAWLSEVD
jgi:hypothetical protein